MSEYLKDVKTLPILKSKVPSVSRDILRAFNEDKAATVQEVVIPEGKDTKAMAIGFQRVLHKDGRKDIEVLVSEDRKRLFLRKKKEEA